MAIKVIVKKRFTNSVKKVAKYLADEWGQNVAIEFAMLIEQKIILISYKFLTGRAEFKTVVNVQIKSILAMLFNGYNFYYWLLKRRCDSHGR